MSPPHRSFLQEFRSLVPLLIRYRKTYIFGLIFLIVTDVGQIIIPRFIGSSVDRIADGNTTATEIGRMMALVITIALFVAVGRYGWRNFIIGNARKIEADLRARIYDKLLLLTESFYQRYKIGDIMARMTNDLQSVRMATGMALIALVDGIFMTLVILLTLFIHYGTLGFIIILPLPLVTAMALFFGRFAGPLFRDVQENFARISGHVQETLSGIRVIKSFAREENALKDFARINVDYGKATMNLVRFFGVLFPAMSFVAGLAVLLLLYFGGLRVLDEQLSPGDFVAALAYLGMLLWPAMGAGWVVSMTQRGAASMKRINEILNEVPEIIDLPNATQTVPVGGIEFRKVHFAYKDTAIINTVSFSVPRGSVIGILGRTGSGKTTLLKLVPRILDPPENTIFFGGQDIRTISRSALRQALGVVPQDVFLFSDTIRNNILFARPNADDATISQSIRIAGLEADLPFFIDGLDTMVGEKGITLSGGQKQRIAIARAIILDPEILILDDALSAVDANTEEQILMDLFELRHGKTTLMVSHRVSALSRCDRIVVMEDGCVSAESTHAELMSQEGFYREVAELQRLEQIEERSS